MADDDKKFFLEEFRDIFINALNQAVIPSLDRIDKDLVVIKKNIQEIKTSLKQISKPNSVVGI